MTREEAIEILEDLDGYFSDNQGRDYDEAFRMAIEALTFEEYGLTCKTCADRNMCVMSAPDGQWKACEDYRPSADGVHIHNDGTLEVKVPNAQKVGRVIVMDTDSHIGGGLFYPESADAVSLTETMKYLTKSHDYCEVVRCKDCRHYKSDGGALMVCDVSDMVVDDADYCSYGERREK